MWWPSLLIPGALEAKKVKAQPAILVNPKTRKEKMIGGWIWPSGQGFASASLTNSEATEGRIVKRGS